MSDLTRFLARLIGGFLVMMAFAMALTKASVVAAVTAIVGQPALAFTWGMLALAAGLALVIGHNRWRGGAAPIIVSLSGWIMLGRAAVMLLASPADLLKLLTEVHFADFYYGYVAMFLVLGSYLAFASLGRSEAIAVAVEL